MGTAKCFVGKKENTNTFPLSCVRLNVGGEIFTTSRETLTHNRESLFPLILDGRIPCAKDGQGNYFIDRDGSHFRHILNFLCNEYLMLPNDFDAFNRLAAEADFYKLPLLKEHIESVFTIQQHQKDDSGSLVLDVFQPNTRGMFIAYTNADDVRSKLGFVKFAKGDDNKTAKSDNKLYELDGIVKIAIFKYDDPETLHVNAQSDTARAHYAYFGYAGAFMPDPAQLCISEGRRRVEGKMSEEQLRVYLRIYHRWDENPEISNIKVRYKKGAPKTESHQQQ